MKITFLGAAHEVTGSRTYIEVGDKKGLVDCGMEQGRDLFENEPMPAAAGELPHCSESSLALMWMTSRLWSSR